VNPGRSKGTKLHAGTTVPVTIGQRFLDELKGGTSKNTAVSPLAKIIDIRTVKEYD